VCHAMSCSNILDRMRHRKRSIPSEKTLSSSLRELANSAKADAVFVKWAMLVSMNREKFGNEVLCC
jgi:hypothetical protein